MTKGAVCEAFVRAYGAHCPLTAEEANGGEYRLCLHDADPNATAKHNYAQTSQCMADVSVSDCGQLRAGNWPATCSDPNAPPPPPAPQDPGGVTVADACNVLMEKHCNRCLPQKMKTCVTQSLKWCYRGRDGSRGTGMTRDQYNECRSTYLSLNCDAAESGYIPMACGGLR